MSEWERAGKCSHPYCDNPGHWFNEDGEWWCEGCLAEAAEEQRAAEAAMTAQTTNAHHYDRRKRR